MQSPTELAEAFRARGLKATPQRRLLFTLLEHDTTHPTADGLYVRASAQMPGISLRTVYTTLTDLVEMGELQAVALGSGATRFDTNVDHHHHGICDDCGAVVDLYVDGSDALGVDDDQFTAHTASIIFSGTCAACRRANPSNTNPPTPRTPTPQPPNTIKEHHHG